MHTMKDMPVGTKVRIKPATIVNPIEEKDLRMMKDNDVVGVISGAHPRQYSVTATFEKDGIVGSGMFYPKELDVVKEENNA